MPSAAIQRLRVIALLEGVSFLVLLGVAMPLKYIAAIPIATKIAGWIHGLLFVALGGALYHAYYRLDWPLKRVAMVLGAALLPFGPFIINARLKRLASDPTSQPATP